MSEQNTELLLIVADESGAWSIKNAGGLRRTWNNLKKEWQSGMRGLNDMLSPARMLSETFFSGYGKHMEHLRAIDNEIQSWLYDLDNCLDHAKDARKAGRLLDMVFWLSQINDRLVLAAGRGKEIVDIHNKNLVKEFYGKHEKPILDDYFSKEDPQSRLVRASIVDDLKERLTNWKMERVYRSRLQKQRLAAEALYNEAKIVVTNVEKLLEQMASARADGDIAQYISSVEKIAAQQKTFQTTFKRIYEANFADLADALRARREEIVQEQARSNNETTPPVVPTTESAPQQMSEVQAPRSEQPDTTSRPGLQLEPPSEQPDTRSRPGLELMEQPAPVLELLPQPQSIPNMPPIPKLKTKVVDVSPPTEDNLIDESVEENTQSPQTQRSVNITAKDDMLDQLLLKKSNQDFFAELQKIAASEDPYLMAALIAKYSGEIEDVDPETSMQLLAIAEGILDV